MEQNFQTSFIPKKPIVEDVVVHSRPTSLFTVLALFAFFAVLIAFGGVYFYRGVLTKQVNTMNDQLKLAKNSFEPEKIDALQQLDKRLNAASEVLSKHVAISPIFETLQKYTLKSIRYSKFEYTFASDSGTALDVKITGQALGYKSIALQADLFNKHDKEIIDPVFSNLSLDLKGNVIFQLEFSVDPSFINYKDLVKNGVITT